MAPGCYGSSVLFRIDATECGVCPHKSDCIATVKPAQREALKMVAKLDTQFQTDKATAVAQWFSKRWTERKEKTVDVSRFNALLTQWSAQNLNPYHLSHGTNPAKRDSEPVLYAIFAFILEYKAFKPRDIQEHLQELFPNSTKSKTQAQVKLICDTLTYAQIIRKEKRGVLCL